MGVVDEAVDLTIARGVSRLRLFVRRENAPEPAWESGRGVAHFDRRLTHVRRRMLPPQQPGIAGAITPDAEFEHFFVGGQRWFRDRYSEDWAHPLGSPAQPRQIGDPTWVLDALRGATINAAAPDATDGLDLSLDLIAAERVLGAQIDIGRARAALLWRARLRAWRRAVPARVWLDAAGCLARVEHLDPPWSRLGGGPTWNRVEFEELGVPAELPRGPSAPHRQSTWLGGLSDAYRAGAETARRLKAEHQKRDYDQGSADQRAS